MKLTIENRAYDVGDTLENASLNDLYYLKLRTVSTVHPHGIGVKALGEALKRFGDFEDDDELVDDIESLIALRALVFLCRRHAGEKVSLDDANDFPLSAIGFELEEHELAELEEAEKPADPPQARPDSDPAGGRHTAAPTTSTTSEPPSTSGSPS